MLQSNPDQMGVPRIFRTQGIFIYLFIFVLSKLIKLWGHHKGGVKSCFNLREASNLVFHDIIFKGDIPNMGASQKLEALGHASLLKSC